MRKIKKILVRIVLFCLLSCILLKPATVKADVALAVFGSGKITYSAVANVGNYSSTLNSAVNAWNNKIRSGGYGSKIGLTATTGANEDVIVSFTATIVDRNLAGYVSLKTKNAMGDVYTPDIKDDCVLTHAFLYVFPGIVMGKVAASSEYGDKDISDCILKTTMHEFGHILGLCHPTDSGIDSVMIQGLSNKATIRDYDLNELYRCWYVVNAHKRR